MSALASLAFGAAGGVVLGEFAFSGFEVPEYITLGGAQQMTLHKLPGGERVIDVLGDDPADIAWSGTLLDRDPWARVRELESLRAAGALLGLQWGPFFYTVIVRSFGARTLYGRASYDIACTVLRNEATAPGAVDPDLTNSVAGDILSALQAAPTAIAPALSAAQTAVAALGPLVPGSPKLLLGIAQLNGVNASLSGLAASSGPAIGQALGGASAGAVTGAASLTAATSNAGLVGQALQAGAYVGRALKNL